MKKLLLIAAMAALALGASADSYKIEKVWENANIPEINANNCRQGLGMNGKFYINDRTTQTISIYDETGKIDEIAGSPNMTIGRDQAGNLVMSGVEFPGNWLTGSVVKVVNPVTGESKEYEIPEEIGDLGRCDVLGIAQGNLLEDGVLYYTTNTSGSLLSKLVITGGEVNVNDCYNPDCGNVTTSTTTPIYFYKDLNGDDALLYYTRTTNPVKLMPDGDNFAGTALSLPNRGTMMACQPFIWDGKELFVYTYKGPGYIDYLDGVAIAEAGAAEPLIYIPATVSARTNGTLAINWLWAEPDADGVTIYQYYPQSADIETGGHMSVFRLTKEEPTPDNVWILGEANDKSWNPTDGVLMDFDAENNVYVADVYFDGRGESGENYFSFTTELAENNDEGGWAYIEPFRFGATAEGDFWYDDMYDGQPLGLTYENYQAFRIMNGDYELVLDKNAMTLTIHRWELGDVDHSRGVDIEDVTILINKVLGNETEVFFPRQANCTLDENGSIDIEDVTALINRVLNGAW